MPKEFQTGAEFDDQPSPKQINSGTCTHMSESVHGKSASTKSFDQLAKQAGIKTLRKGS